MESTPDAVAATTFRIVKKGYDPDEVRAYLNELGSQLTKAREHASQMESRARQAVAKAQEVMQAHRSSPAQDTGVRPEDAETISRTLLLAQRTADATTAEARQDAERMRIAAKAEADSVLGDARLTAAREIEHAKADARRAGESERVQVEEELQQLLARLEFLRDDVAQLERYADSERERMRAAADALHDLSERPVGGLGETRPPVLSAAADMPPPRGDRASTPAGVDRPSIAAILGEEPPPFTMTTRPDTEMFDDEEDDWASPDAVVFADEVASDDEPTQALHIVSTESESPEQSLFGHDITAEVPVVEAPRPSGMRIIDDD
jgi:DivIVA domain-containing protein